MLHQGFPGGSDGKESACSAGDLGLIPGLGRSPGGGDGNPLQSSYLLLSPTMVYPHGQRFLECYNPCGCKDSGRIKQLSIAVFIAPPFTIAVYNMGVTCMSINREMGKEDVVQIQNVMLLSHKKEQNNAIRSNMDGPGYCHTK